jgi:group I intron endonuclease
MILDVLHQKKEMTHIIYSIFNLVTKRYYIGSTSKQGWYLRKHNHISSLKKGKHHSFKLQSSWRRHGEQNFVFQILEDDIDSFELRAERETFWIKYFDSFKNGYNCTEDASKGRIVSEETRKKASITRKLLFKKGEVKNPNPKGEKRDVKLMAEINARKKVPVIQYDKNMNFIKEWKGVVDASTFYGLSKNCIFNCLRKGPSYTAGGFKWRYKHG